MSLLLFGSPIEVSEIPRIEQNQQHDVRKKDLRCRPLPPIEFPAGKRPEYRSRKEGMGMQGHVGQYMQPSCAEFPERVFQDEPHEDKDEKKNDETLRIFLLHVHGRV